MWSQTLATIDQDTKQGIIVAQLPVKSKASLIFDIF